MKVQKIEDHILSITKANSIRNKSNVQSLWSGYGDIVRYELEGGDYTSVIVKHIKWPTAINHPRGWNTDISHKRKLKSYQVEKYWYENQSTATSAKCRIPKLLTSIDDVSEVFLVMEDLNASGFDVRRVPETVTLGEVRNCIEWLACFHATFLGAESDGLWSIGTYWHLDTRSDEWKTMRNVELKSAAHAIDQKLSHAEFQTIVHGDAKLANFCFSSHDEVAAVDFQYIGKGVGVKDVAYFISSCFDENECELYAEELLDLYFNTLEKEVDEHIDFRKLKKEWTKLYPFAWADFYRFLDGWSPGHWKLHGYSKRQAELAMRELKEI